MSKETALATYVNLIIEWDKWWKTPEASTDSTEGLEAINKKIKRAREDASSQGAGAVDFAAIALAHEGKTPERRRVLFNVMQTENLTGLTKEELEELKEEFISPLDF